MTNSRTAVHEERVAFFLQHAGWSYAAGATTGEQALARVQCAEELARAEEVASSRGWWWNIYDDIDGPMEDDVDSVGMVERGEAICLYVNLHDEDGRVLAGLHDIVVESADSPYLRVIAAELASELLASHAECHATTTHLPALPPTIMPWLATRQTRAADGGMALPLDTTATRPHGG